MKDKYKTLMLGYVIALGICLIFRIFGYNFSTLASEYQWFIDMCAYIDTKPFILSCIKYIVFTTSTMIFLQGVLGINKYERKHLWIFLTVCLLEIVRFCFANNLFITLPIDVFIVVGISIIVNKKLWLKASISFIALFLFELVAGFIKQIDRTTIDYTLQGLLASLEYYIMIFFYKNMCLEIKYNNRKEKNKIWAKSGFLF